MSKVCPSDVYRVWKSGSCLRVDTTLLGFEHMTWLKGRRSYIFKGGGESVKSKLIIEVNIITVYTFFKPFILILFSYLPVRTLSYYIRSTNSKQKSNRAATTDKIIKNVIICFFFLNQFYMHFEYHKEMLD